MCPISSRVKGYPFEVSLPKGLSVSGVVLADQLKSLDWRARQVELVCKVPAEVIAEAQAEIQTLVF